MKHRFTDGEPAYLRDRREAVARPGANLIAGIVLSTASAFGVALVVPESGLSERAYAARVTPVGSTDVRKPMLCVKLDSSTVDSAQLPIEGSG
ncbi:hypothetical protein PYH37_001893 [Sinorhizobium numidicum]|uniref:Uncharacterized protein n=1 Tax=Sinorhizobium numidicum TaxID=680248 RepID=A0ABY8CTB7_9HYPH|nr:hypothetical protein [Sinorhizobium numidicum]WEX74463.1 hypothetical protein PYH37_001893 [Sinorhizobium numidicum]WEX80453.1 hypothetical protein PYH38_001895 [Sinorhizobium numidicum]